MINFKKLWEYRNYFIGIALGVSVCSYFLAGTAVAVLCCIMSGSLFLHIWAMNCLADALSIFIAHTERLDVIETVLEAHLRGNVSHDEAETGI